MNRTRRKNLKAGSIASTDRILFATDIGGWTEKSETIALAENYARAFRILETSNKVEGGLFGEMR